MKATGIVRKIDELGRVVIPKEIRKLMGWADGDPMEMFVDDNGVYLKKYTRGCVFCEEVTDDPKKFGDHLVCANCRKVLASS